MKSNRDPAQIGPLREALLFGFTSAASIIAVGLIGAALLWLARSAPEDAWRLFLRIALIGTAVGFFATLSRWLTMRFTRQPLATSPPLRDWSSFGFILGLIITGYLTHSRMAGESERVAVSAGEHVEISGPTLTGEPFDLETYRGKVVLVDFWATWCGPCLEELPNLQAAYDKFHADGLEVVAVSFDDDRERLQEYLKYNPLPWPQIIFDDPESRGFANPNGLRHQVDAIPCLLLVDAQGRLLERGLRGAEINASVAKALGKSTGWDSNFSEWPINLVSWLLIGIMSSAWSMLLAITGLTSLLASAIQIILYRRHYATQVVQQP